jgi:hypothetical protein
VTRPARAATSSGPHRDVDGNSLLFTAAVIEATLAGHESRRFHAVPTIDRIMLVASGGRTEESSLCLAS